MQNNDLSLAKAREFAFTATMTSVFDLSRDLEAGLSAAHSALSAGMLVAVPTETVYGLAADATNSDAVSSIYATKGRPSFNPLIAHVANLEMARRYGQFAPIALALARAFWPGPLTLVVRATPNSGISPLVTAKLTTIALRQPKGAMAQLSATIQKPLAAPSANKSGKLSPTQAEHVAESLGDAVAVILDDGPCSIGVESTIVQVDDLGCILLREGGVPREDIEAVLGSDLRDPTEGKIVAPGMLLSHYAPSKPVELNVTHVDPRDALLAFGDQHANQTVDAAAALNLSPKGDLAEAARNLFAMLAQLDQSSARKICVQRVPFDGLGAAVNDRLKRAAQDRNPQEKKLDESQSD